MALTIYTVSDPAVVGSVMTSMAMFFGQDSWVGGALKLALIISLLVILAKGVLAREGLRLDAMLLQLLVIMVAFIPKTTVIIEQFEHNAPTHVVDDVPYAIAMPGAIAGTFALYMTQKIETVMSSVDGKYIAPSGELDPYAPARMLMQIATAPLDPTRFVDPNLLQTIHHAARFCGKPSMTNIKFEQAKNSFAAFADEMTMDGTKTFIFDAANPYRDGGGSGRWATCEESATYIRDVGAQLESSNALMFENTMKGIAQTADTKRYSDTQTGSTNDKTAEDILPIINRVAPMHAQLNTLALANVMSYTAFAQLARDSKGNIDDSIELQRDTGLFNWAKEESAKSLLVSATAPKFMDILFFIFIASTPIVMFVVAANPATGFKVAGAYVLFGLWTQSWIPMMAIISGWYQAEIKNFATMGTNGLTPEYLSGLMRHVSTATITASNMMQSAPYLMFAIMTGSMFAMSSMIAKVAPSGGAASGGMGSGSGAGGGTSPLGGDLVGSKSVGAIQTQQLRQAQSMVNGTSGIGGVNPGGDVASVVPGLPTLNQGGDFSSGATANSQQSAATRKSLDAQLARTMADTHALAKASSNYVKGENLANHMRAAGYNAKYDAASNSITADGKTFSFADGFKSTGSADVTARGSGSGGMGGFAAAVAAGIQKIAQDVQSLSAEKKLSTNTGTSNGHGVSGTQGETASTGVSGARGSDLKNTAQSAKQLSDTAQKIASQSEALDKADALVKSAGDNTAAGSATSIKGSDVAQQWGGRNNSSDSQTALQKVVAAIGGELGAKLSGAIAANQKMLENQGALSTLGHDAVAAAAALKALDSMSHSGAPGAKMQALTGMAKLAAAAGFNDVSPAMAQLAKAENLIADVKSNIAKMDGKVTPAVNTAVAAATTQTSDEEAAKLRANVGTQQRADGGSAANLYGGAQAGVATVDANGRALHASHVKNNHEPATENATNPSPLVAEAARAVWERNAVKPTAESWAQRVGMDPEKAKEAFQSGERQGFENTTARNANAEAAQQERAAVARANANPETPNESAARHIDQKNAELAEKGLPQIDKAQAMEDFNKLSPREKEAMQSIALSGSSASGLVLKDGNGLGHLEESKPPQEPAVARAVSRAENDAQNSGGSPNTPGASPVENGTSAVGAILQTVNGAVERGTTAAGETVQAVSGATGSGTTAATVVTEAVPSGGSDGATPGTATTGDHKGIDLSKPGGGGGTPAEPASAAPTSAKPNAQRGGSGEGPNGGGKPKAPGRS